MQLSRSNFADDVLEGPEPPKPLCSYCGREVDTIMEAHGLACTSDSTIGMVSAGGCFFPAVYQALSCSTGWGLCKGLRPLLAWS